MVDSPFEALSEQILRLPSADRVFIAIDGVDGSGKSTFADNLATWLRGRPVVILHVDDFRNPTSKRYARGRTSPEGFWLDTYDYDTFRAYALDPLDRDSDGWYRTKSYDSTTDERAMPPVIQAPKNALIVVEGMFLHRDELKDRWDLSVFLHAPLGETARRMAERNGSHPDPNHESMRRYVNGQRIYFANARPWERASPVVDNTGFANPCIIDASTLTALL